MKNILNIVFSVYLFCNSGFNKPMHAASVEGRVTEWPNEEAGIGGVVVEVYNAAGVVADTTTDDFGKYFIENLDPGSVGIRFKHSGFDQYPTEKSADLADSVNEMKLVELIPKGASAEFFVANREAIAKRIRRDRNAIKKDTEFITKLPILYSAKAQYATLVGVKSFDDDDAVKMLLPYLAVEVENASDFESVLAEMKDGIVSAEKSRISDLLSDGTRLKVYEDFEKTLSVSEMAVLQNSIGSSVGGW
ncbi:carboxypeptidase-like regulatory domain-containing protein [Pelagicoccus sp. SDUM812002]|uniref:carboxypeptidase-like regulatory domain-containing protein n=1 Tax=Pelagicoccus sp. SDUM812002 TaxID=3041266 RepID=UPI00281007DB|nr:carboxypeptidase-like regulatory domain-containing protein [Pelagicoccus sp. SDUM812002]MDQ8185808.1 carboxypeptidase-like regulatory domain-containing protein [Pelagicoccus sp. SDUM812002]